MRKIICDRCGTEIVGNRLGYISVGWRARSDDSLIQNSPYENCDYCESCMAEIAAFIDNAGTEADEDPGERSEPIEPGQNAQDPEKEEGSEEEEDAEEEKEIPEPQTKRRAPEKSYKGVNLRKLRELVKEGKTAQQIADELGCSVASYYKHRKHAEKLWKEGKL